MRDALGGVVTIAIIVIFMVIMIGYLAFNVNYTKAFKMKDKIITYYNEYNGKCESECKKKITEYAKSIGYSAPNGWHCPEMSGSVNSVTPSPVNGLYCAYKFEATSNDSADSIKDRGKYYYKIVTKIHLEVPVINNVFSFNTFTIIGNTKLYNAQ